ncbi:MAG: glycosyltransferase [Bacteroidota bacterium]
MKDVSIIIVNYNQTQFLRSLISYLLDYVYECEIEIILVDSNSNDQIILLDLVKDLQSKTKIEISLLELNENKGPSFARNQGVKKATGKYLQFIDADDWINKHKIDLQYSFASKNDWPTFIASEWARVHHESSIYNPRILSIHTPNFNHPTLIQLIKSNGFVHLASGLIKKEDFLSINGFDEDKWLIEDVHLQIRLFIHNQSFLFCKTSFPIFFYRQTPNSLSKRNPQEFYSSVLDNAFLVSKIYSNNHVLNEVDTDEVIAVIYDICKNTFKVGTLEGNKTLTFRSLDLINEVTNLYIFGFTNISKKLYYYWTYRIRFIILMIIIILKKQIKALYNS